MSSSAVAVSTQEPPYNFLKVSQRDILVSVCVSSPSSVLRVGIHGFIVLEVIFYLWRPGNGYKWNL
jgi:hypothetical protein